MFGGTRAVVWAEFPFLPDLVAKPKPGTESGSPASKEEVLRGSMSERSGRRFSKNTILVTAGSFFADMSTEMLTPILPIFLTQVLHANGSVVGLVDGIAQAVRNMIDGFSGSISDRLRKRRVIVLTGYAMAAVAKPFMGISSVWQGVL